MSITDNTQKVSASFRIIQGTGGAHAASTPKTYTPFYSPLSETPDLDERVRAAHEVLNLVLDAGAALSRLMATNRETEGLSSLIDGLLGGIEYASDVLVPPDGDAE